MPGLWRLDLLRKCGDSDQDSMWMADKAVHDLFDAPLAYNRKTPITENPSTEETLQLTHDDLHLEYSYELV